MAYNYFAETGFEEVANMTTDDVLPHATQPKQTPGIFGQQVNISALFFALLLTFFFVKLLSLLPEKYYFSFAKVVDASSTSAFIVEAPGVSLDRYCEILRKKDFIKGAKYEYVADGGNGPECNVIKPEPVNTSPPENPANQTMENQTPDQAPDLAQDSTQSTVPQATESQAQNPVPEEEREEPEVSEESDFTPEQQEEISVTIRQDGQYFFWLALALKMLPAFVAGFVTYLVFKEDSFLAAPLGIAILAFLLCWPVIALWNSVASADFTGQKNLFFALYASYVAMYYALARLGALSAEVSQKYSLIKTGGWELDVGKVVSTFVASSLTTGLMYLMTQTLAASK